MCRVKMCGMFREEDIRYVNELLPDYIGFIFYEKSHRNVTGEKAAFLKSLLSHKIKAVGVFVDKPIEEAAEISAYVGLDVIQLHGSEDEAYIKGIKSLTGLPVIKALRYLSEEQIREAEALPADYLLIDTWKKGIVGGTGETFDWNSLPDISKPFFLAGGINTENITQAMKTGAYCIDVSSGIETGGLKDYNKMKQLMERIKG